MSGSAVNWPAELAVMEAETTGEENVVERVAWAIREVRPGLTLADGTFTDAALAAIIAMREPTEAMLRSTDDLWLDHGGTCDDCATQIWQAMIDAALC